MTEKKGPLLHEILAVVGDLESASNKIQEETVNTFIKKSHLFDGQVKKYEPFNQEEIETLSYDENITVDTTVKEKLEYMFTHVSRCFDAILQKEKANQTACADIIIDDIVIAESVPAPFLLGLEKRIKRLREIFSAIPTLSPGMRWEKDEATGKNIYRTNSAVVKFKTQKVPKSKVLVPATKEHRAEIEKWTEDEKVGKFTTIYFSGAFSPAEKSEYLSRIDDLAHAIKKARQRANCEIVKDTHIGDKLIDYIIKG